MKILLTGGAGFIGSHIARSLLLNRHTIKIIDNLSNSNHVVIDNLQAQTNQIVQFANTDVLHQNDLLVEMQAYQPDVVIHLAGLKSVSDSMREPMNYYATNVSGTINVLRSMDHVGCKKIIFSSTATVYGDAQYLPLDEQHPIKPHNPYGYSKYMAEQVITDWSRNHQKNTAIILRYFNPIGSSPDYKFGENPLQAPTNLLPVLIKSAKSNSEFYIYGNDYSTDDGTAERDFIHVMDLAEAHVLAALTELSCETHVLNLGTGRPTSVKKMVETFSEISGTQLKVKVKKRRAGDIESSWTKNDYALQSLGWKPTRSVRDGIADAWNFSKKI